MDTQELDRITHSFRILTNDGTQSICEARWQGYLDFASWADGHPRSWVTFGDGLWDTRACHWSATARFVRTVWVVRPGVVDIQSNYFTTSLGADRGLAATESRPGIWSTWEAERDATYARLRAAANSQLGEVKEADLPALTAKLKEGFAARDVERLD